MRVHKFAYFCGASSYAVVYVII